LYCYKYPKLKLTLI